MNSENSSQDNNNLTKQMNKIKKYNSVDVNKGASPVDLVMLITLLFALNN